MTWPLANCCCVLVVFLLGVVFLRAVASVRGLEISLNKMLLSLLAWALIGILVYVVYTQFVYMNRNRPNVIDTLDLVPKEITGAMKACQTLTNSDPPTTHKEMYQLGRKCRNAMACRRFPLDLVGHLNSCLLATLISRDPESH